MKTRQWAVLIPLCAMLTIFSVGLAEAADGTLRLTFKYKDPITGAESNLNEGYIYLRSATKQPPMEKFFSQADYIFGRANLFNGQYLYSVPAGQYYIRVTQRKIITYPRRPYGPPEEGDLTWFQTIPVTITAGTTTNLGTKYAVPFGASPITVTGTVKDSSGAPRAGVYVRATTEVCSTYNYCTDDGAYCEQLSNFCGPVKYMALHPTDANGRYTLNLRDAGTYYISTISSWDTELGCSGYCAPPIIGTGQSPTPVTVQTGDVKTADIVTYW